MSITVKTCVVVGRGVGDGIALGRLKFIDRQSRLSPPPVYRSADAAAEHSRLEGALSLAEEELDSLHARALSELGENEAEIFEIHKMLLRDPDLVETAKKLITDGYSAEHAIRESATRAAAALSALDDEYLSGRADDLGHIADRVRDILMGNAPAEIDSRSAEMQIIVARDLSPAQTVGLRRDSVAAFVTFAGSPNSHTAILARSLGLPAVISTGAICEDADGCEAIVDAASGKVYISPSPEQYEEYLKRRASDEARRVRLNSLRGVPTVTPSGRRIRLYANIGNLEEAKQAYAADAEGIGLLRSEFLYLGRDRYPAEDELFTAFRDISLAMGGREVIIRTLDIGADKSVPYFRLDKEENPALGLRGVRLTLSRRELFLTQLRAICRASAYGHLSVMIPMVSTPEELHDCRALLRSAQEELDSRGIPCDKSLRLGIMVETPAAALLSDTLARECDFFSIGTNDLTQYTLAADRQNPQVAELCERGLEPVLRLIELTVKNAHAVGIWVGVCGELAADGRYTRRLLRAGVDEFSVSPPYILSMRDTIRNSD